MFSPTTCMIVFGTYGLLISIFGFWLFLSRRYADILPAFFPVILTLIALMFCYENYIADKSAKDNASKPQEQSYSRAGQDQ